MKLNSAILGYILNKIFVQHVLQFPDFLTAYRIIVAILKCLKQIIRYMTLSKHVFIFSIQNYNYKQ